MLSMKLRGRVRLGEAPAEPTLDHLHHKNRFIAPIRVRILQVVVFPTDSGLPQIGRKPNLR